MVAYARKLAKNLKVVQRHMLARFPELWHQAQCVFVLSTGRTGTETLARILSYADNVDAYHEPRPQLMMARKHARVQWLSEPETYRQIFAGARADVLWKAQRTNCTYAETSARLTFFAPVIADLLPNAKFLFIHRHPGDVVRSGMRRGWYVNHPADDARIEPVEQEVSRTTWERWDPFTKICWYWDAYNRFALDFRASVSAERIIMLNANDLYSGKALPEIFDFIGHSMPAAHLLEQELRQKHNAQKKASFPRYDHWTNDMKQTLQELAGETMERLGYHDQLLPAN